MQRPPVTSFQEASTESRVVIEKHRGIFPEFQSRTRAACCTSLANRLFLFFLHFFLLIFFLIFFLLFNVLPCFCSRTGYHPAIVPRHKRVYAYKSCLFIPRIELKLNFFLYPAREKVREGGSQVGAFCSHFISLSLSLCRKSIGYRRKSSGNPGERVVATRKRRNEVSSRCSGSRPTLRFFERVPQLRAREYRVSRI